ncbi:MAG TPA: hypothetical protein VJB41_00370 [Patescibacteria group bacterium]|nr:hypothetical protein [Patescibacteria group bacterium]
MSFKTAEGETTAPWCIAGTGGKILKLVPLNGREGHEGMTFMQVSNYLVISTGLVVGEPIIHVWWRSEYDDFFHALGRITFVAKKENNILWDLLLSRDPTSHEEQWEALKHIKEQVNQGACFNVSLLSFL